METNTTNIDRRVRQGLTGLNVLGFAVVALAMPFASWMADASGAHATAKRAVSYKLNELGNPDEVNQLYARLRAAGQQVCAVYDKRTISSARAHDACVESAVGTAVAKVNAPLLTLRHAAETGARAVEHATVASR